MIFPYNYLTAVVAVVASLVGAFSYGQHTATVSAQRDALKRDVAMYRSIDVLARKLRTSDEALSIEQQRVAEVRRVEVTKYVDKYRTKLVDRPVIIECVNDSGLLDVINSAMPTAATRVDTTK